jgi:hypothetical protein
MLSGQYGGSLTVVNLSFLDQMSFSMLFVLYQRKKEIFLPITSSFYVVLPRRIQIYLLYLSLRVTFREYEYLLMMILHIFLSLFV